MMTGGSVIVDTRGDQKTFVYTVALWYLSNLIVYYVPTTVKLCMYVLISCPGNLGKISTPL